MAVSGKEKAFCTLEYHQHRSVTIVQRHFRTKYGKEPPSDNSIRRWYAQFVDTGCLCKGKSSGRPAVSQADVNRIRDVYLRSPKKSTTRCSRELQVPQTTVWRVLRRRLKVKPYRLQLRQALTANDKVLRFNFCMALQERFEDDGFLDRLVFSDEATFHVNGKVNKQNVRIWGTTNPHCYVELVRDSPKVNVFCAVSNTKVYGPFFFNEQIVTGLTYLDMLTEWLLPQLSDDRDDYVLQQDGAPPHFHREVRAFLNQELPQRWMGRGTESDLMLLPFPPRSPDLTPCDFFLWGYVKDQVFVPPLPVDIKELKQRIRAAFETITVTMLTRVWEEMDYRVDVCRVTRGAHIEHL